MLMVPKTVGLVLELTPQISLKEQRKGGQKWEEKQNEDKRQQKR